MKKLNKKRILFIINEEISSQQMGEMAHPRNEQWRTDRIPTPEEFDVPQASSINPDTGELEQGKIYSDTMRISPNGSVLYEFITVNPANDKRIKSFYDAERNLIYKFVPRKDIYGTKYTQPKMDVQLSRGELEPEKYQERKTQLKEGQVKRTVLFPPITKLFTSTAIKNHLFICGLPLIVGGKDFTEPITNRNRKMIYNGKDLEFELHSTRDEKDIQDALDKIISFREKEYGSENDVEVGSEFGAKKHVRKYGGNIYPGGKWSPTQRTHSEKHHELTPIYKLHKKAVQGGEISYNITADLKVKIDIFNGDMMDLKMSLDFYRSSRELTKSRGVSKGRIVPTLHANSTEEFPEGVTPETFDLMKNKDFFLPQYYDCLKQLGEQILEIDPDETLPEIDPTALGFEDEDEVDFEF